MKIKKSVQEFQQNVFPKMEAEFNKLASGQSPETLFITCSDSRIDPALLTQTNPGEIFVIRNAGNFVPKPGTGELAIEGTIEFAVKALQVQNIVVCGHSHCGAVKGLLDLDSLDALPAVKEWVQTSKAILDGAPDPLSVEEAIRRNVLLQLDHLALYPYIADSVNKGTLSLHGWVYSFESGEVEFLETNQT